MKEPLEDFDYSGEPPFTGISRKTAKELAIRYKRDCQSKLSGQSTSQQATVDARSMLIPIETLKKYIWEIERQVRDQGAQNELGIRIYYGKYPDLKKVRSNPRDPLFDDLNNVPLEYSFLHTLFLVPAFKADDGIFKDFDPFHSGGALLEQLNPDEEEANNESGMTAIMNHGNLTPPPFTMDQNLEKENGLSF